MSSITMASSSSSLIRYKPENNILLCTATISRVEEWIKSLDVGLKASGMAKELVDAVINVHFI